MRQQVVIRTSDSFPLAAYFFPAADDSKLYPPVILAAATGVPASFYFDFADWLSDLGSAVVLFDYRYLGASWPTDVDQKSRESKIAALRAAKDVTISNHWVKDFEAALGFLIGRFPSQKAIVVG